MSRSQGSGVGGQGSEKNQSSGVRGQRRIRVLEVQSSGRDSELHR